MECCWQRSTPLASPHEIQAAGEFCAAGASYGAAEVHGLIATPKQIFPLIRQARSQRGSLFDVVDASRSFSRLLCDACSTVKENSMKGYRCLVVLICLGVGTPAYASDGVRVEITKGDAAQTTEVSGSTSPLVFPEDVDFTLEPLYPARNNLARAKIQLRYSCVPESGGGLVIPCYITIDEAVARDGSGGHVAHPGERPPGRQVPSSGWVGQDGYLHSTYYASEVAGVMDVAIHCRTMFGSCKSGKVVFGIGVQGMEDLGQGVGYILTGHKPQHPSNHWGVPGFLAAVRGVAAQFAKDNPDSPLSYNDISLEYGGVFDVATQRAAGYDWTPPHASHRLGTNMDIGIPRGAGNRALALRLFQMAGVRVLQEDQFHWHLSY